MWYIQKSNEKDTSEKRHVYKHEDMYTKFLINCALICPASGIIIIIIRPCPLCSTRGTLR